MTSANDGIRPLVNNDVPNWIYNSNYSYWTMSQYNGSMNDVWTVISSGNLLELDVYNYDITVRPVITLSKSLISTNS